VFNSPEHAAFVEKFVQAYKTGAIAPGAVGKDDRQLQQTLDNELVKRTKAYQNGHIVYLQADLWYLSGGGLQSFAAMIDEVGNALP